MSAHQETPCYHCGDECPPGTIPVNDHSFCCDGCQTVYELLDANDLGAFYAQQERNGNRPKANQKQRFAHLDAEELRTELYDFYDGNTGRITLLLPDIHCASCVWLLENLHRLEPAIGRVQVNFVRKEASIAFDTQSLKLSALAELLVRIGYTPRFDRQRDTKGATPLTHQFYTRLGVAGFCFGNIMLFSFPEYLGASSDFTTEFSGFFSILILALSVPVISYSAFPYLKAAYLAIKHRQINIDVPVALGMVALFGRSAYEIISGTGAGFMDSFAGFTFFLLAGRWFQNKTYQALSFDRDYRSYFPLAVFRVEADKEVPVKIALLKKGDVVRMHHEEILPADSLLLSEEADLDYSFVTGESMPVQKVKHDRLFAGGKIVGGSILVSVEKPVDQSYLTQLWNQDEHSKQGDAQFATMLDRASRSFTWAVLSIALVGGVAWAFYDSSRMVEVVTAVLIVACPCALALSVPFTFGNIIRLFGRHGFYLKNASSVEQLARTDTLVFDKTGTLTQTAGTVISWNGPPLAPNEERSIASATANSRHPMSQQIRHKLATHAMEQLRSFTEVPGSGIEADTEVGKVRVGAAGWAAPGRGDLAKGRTYVSVDGKLRGHFYHRAQLRAGVSNMLHGLSGQRLYLLSGDGPRERSRFRELFPAWAGLQFEQRPDEKRDFVEALTEQGANVTMLGDGLNDAGALQAAPVGIVVAEDVFNFSPASNGILQADQLPKLPAFLRTARAGISIVKLCFVFSVLYNLVGLVFALSGTLTPLIAAILMPLSSISVVALSSLLVNIVGRRILRNLT